MLRQAGTRSEPLPAQLSSLTDMLQGHRFPFASWSPVKQGRCPLNHNAGESPACLLPPYLYCQSELQEADMPRGHGKTVQQTEN